MCVLAELIGQVGMAELAQEAASIALTTSDPQRRRRGCVRRPAVVSSMSRLG